MMKLFNIFSQSPSLRINGESRPFSIFGSIIGFFTLITLLIGIFFILLDYFSQLNFKLNSYIDQSARPDIDLKDFKLAYLLVEPNGKDIKDIDRLFKISAMFWDIYLPKFGENKTQEIDITPIKNIKCNEYKNGTEHKEEFDNFHKIYETMICLDIPSVGKNLKGVYGNLGRYYFILFVSFFIFNFYP